MCFCSRLRRCSSQKQLQPLRIGNGEESLPYLLACALGRYTLRRFFHLRLLGHGLAILPFRVKNPLRSRSAPLGLSSLTPPENKKVCIANYVLECLAWCAGRTLRACQLLEGIRDARRAAAYLCQITGGWGIFYVSPLSKLSVHWLASSGIFT